MKIKYEFATETVEVDVNQDFGTIIEDMDREEYNVNHRETRRHVTMDTRKEAEWLADRSGDPYEQINSSDMSIKLADAVSKLTPKQQALIQAIYVEGYSFKGYAEKIGVSPQTIRKQHQVMIEKLRNLMS